MTSKRKRRIHIAMMNSFNLLTGRVDSEVILASDYPLFAHQFDDSVEQDEVASIIEYFESIDYEEGVEEMRQVYVNLFVLKEDEIDVGICECVNPIFHEYEPYIKCTICEKKVEL